MQRWQSIHHSQGDLPRLFVKASFDQDGYDVRVTDLSRIWTERLSKDGILDQANRQNCSVDPSEDDEQLSVLLQKVQSALSQGSQTSLSLSATKKGGLKFRLGAPLPAPLPEFEWEVNLHRASDNSIEEELVSPLLRKARNLTQNLESLIAELQAKDKIISKITDRLETSGHDLSTVFPGVANVKLSRKKSQQEQLARHVKGLGRFDEAAWRAQVATGDAEAILGTKVVNAVLSSLPSTKGGFKRSEHDGDWWRAIPAGQYLDLDDVKDQQSDHMRDGTNASQDGIHGHGATELEQDDGFQKQATPPHLRHSTPSAHEEDENMDEDTHQASTPQPQPQLQLGTTHQQSHGDDSTDDEDDLDGPSQTSRPPTKPAHANAEPEPEPPAQPLSPPPVPGPQPSGSSAHDDETEDEDDLDQPSQHPPKATPTPQPTSQQQPQSPQATAASPRKGPGTIGGRASIPPASKEPTPAHESIEDPEPAPKAKPKSKLGTLCGKKPQPPPTAASPPSSSQNSAPPQPTRRMGVIGGKRAATPSSNATPPAEPRRESPAARAPRQEKRRTPSPPQEEKANAKRDLLKKELEEKANKAPAKKKRKF